MLTPIWLMIYESQPKTLLRLVGLGFCLQTGEQVVVRMGDSAERLMRSRSYRRIGRRLKEVRWE